MRNSKVRIAIIALALFLVTSVGLFISCGRQIQEMARPEALTFASSAPVTPTLEWLVQFGTNNSEFSYDVCADDSGIFVAGEIGWDCFLEKYDSSGNQLWARQFGTPPRDYARGVCTDGSGVYVAGYTDGAFPGQTPAGGRDLFLRKFDAEGNELWTRQFGSSTYDYGFGVAADSSGIYVAGFTFGTLPGEIPKGSYDACLIKYDADGNQLWARQFGTSGSDMALAVCADDSGVYVSGHTYGTLGDQSFGGIDVFVRKYDADGKDLWTTQLGTWSTDYSYAIAADASGIYAAGYTYYYGPGSFGGTDMYLSKLDREGELLWTRQYGTSQNEFCHGVSAYASRVYVGGYTYGAFPGQEQKGNFDAFLISYDADGNQLWTIQYGTPAQDEGRAVCAVSSAVYTAGHTYGVFPGQIPKGYLDGFLAKFSAGLKATVEFDPDVLNLSSKGKWVTAYIEFPEGYSVNDIDVSTVMLNGKISAELKPTAAGMVKFDRAGVQSILEPGEEVEIKITGEFAGKAFEGTDTIRVISK